MQESSRFTAVRAGWLREVVELCQVRADVASDSMDDSLRAARDLLTRAPRALTAVEALILRGLAAELMLRQAIRLQFVPATALRLLQALPLEPRVAAAHASEGGHPKIVLALTLLAASSHVPDIRLSAIASEIQLTPSHLSRLLRRETGLGFEAHLRNARLAHGATLLGSARHSVKEVAAAVGYRWAQDFSRHFARRFGMSPARWRRCAAR
jgi:transcriptional regulator GlxA family with amidase domain